MTGTQRAEHASGPTQDKAQDQRSPDRLRADLGELRAELAQTVEELAHRADIPARARARKDETVALVRLRIERARKLATEKAPVVRSALQERPALTGAGALALIVLMVRSLRRRRAAR